jgi:integrase
VTSIRLKFVKAYVDRHGRARHYVRRPGHKLVPLPGLPGSPEFMAAYAYALEAAPKATTEVGASRTRAGSISAMIVGYMGSAAFHKLAPASRAQYQRILGGLRREYGNLPIASLQRKHVMQLLDGKATAPGAARCLLRTLRLLLQYAIDTGVREDDPTAGVRVRMPKSDGYRTWTEEDIARFEAAYPIGTKPRLALALLLGTAARRADVVRLGRQNVRGGLVHMTQQKTGKQMAIPVTTELAEAINAAAPTDHLVFLVNEHGKAFTAEVFTKWFVRQCERAGLTGLSPHGLRKASCRRLAEAGCSAHEIAAISGHASLAEVQRYTKAADQTRMARNAMDRLRRTEGQR